MPPSAAALQLAFEFTPEPDPRLGTTLHRLDEARELVVQMLDGVEPPKPHPLIPLSSMPIYEPPEDRTLVVRRGRLCSGGKRRGARLMRRFTAYFSPEVFEELQAFAVAERAHLSDLVEDAVIEMLERR